LALSSATADDGETAAEDTLLAPVIELCRRCGFDIPADADDGCPGCAGLVAPAPSLPARKMAGEALPSRSVRRLPATRPRRAPDAADIGPAEGARSAFGYATLFLLLTLAATALGWASRLQRFVPALPEGTAERFDDVAALTTAAAVAGVLVGVLAMLVWSVRRLRVALARRAERRLLRSLEPLPR
jgi:hypothetical protein